MTRDIVNQKLAEAISLIVVALVALSLTSCDVDIFGSTWKQLGAGYQLVQSEIPDECGVIAPGEKGGPLAREIGWRKPFIIFRESSSQLWTVINTQTRFETSISEPERTSNPNYAEIPIYRADNAWRRLSRYKRQW